MPKGCLAKIILVVIITFTGLTVLVAGTYIGYILLQDGLKKQLNATNEELRSRAEQVADFSRIPPGYSVTKALNLLSMKIVLASHPSNTQVMGIVDSGLILNLNDENLTLQTLEEKIKTLISFINKQKNFKIDNFTVERLDSFRALNQTIPYMKVSFSILGEEKQEFIGIIGIIKNTKTNKDNLIISYSSPNQYRQYVAERFFQKIEF
ncbi:MAG: hypothetical protein A2Y25_05400 [Candidatus Melainabacteria bacterium GWF2_37_15]|nr:MAG: hypothetical protein A2Y25_05400 [Candidatus Melainabacteria bacterium GWF2_37_15]